MGGVEGNFRNQRSAGVRQHDARPGVPDLQFAAPPGGNPRPGVPGVNGEPVHVERVLPRLGGV